MLLRKLSSWRNYPQECCHVDHKDSSECQGEVSPYQGETDSFDYEVIGYCEKHYNEQLDATTECDGCNREVKSVRYETQTMLMLCTSCFNREQGEW